MISQNIFADLKRPKGKYKLHNKTTRSCLLNEKGCHSNHSSNLTEIKKILYVEDNVINMHEKYQLHPLYGLRRFF